MGRRIELLFAADGGAHLGAAGGYAGLVGATESRPSLGVTPDGRLFLPVRPQSYDSQGVIDFLRILLRKIPGKLLMIWDGSPIHRSNAIKTFLAQGAAQRIHLERLPAYAPDCNPDEGVWNLMQRVELANISGGDVDELEHEVIKAGKRLRRTPDRVRACSRQAGYYL